MKHILLLFLLLVVMSCAKKESESASTETPSLQGACGYVTRHEIEDAIGTRLAEEPAEINEEYLGGKGCAYSGEKENTEAHFAYLIFPSAEAFEKVRAGEKTSGAGEEAYTINGPDAQQLWVRDENRYVMIAIGDVPRPSESATLAKLVLKRLKDKPLDN